MRNSSASARLRSTEATVSRNETSLDRIKIVLFSGSPCPRLGRGSSKDSGDQSSGSISSSDGGGGVGE